MHVQVHLTAINDKGEAVRTTTFDGTTNIDNLGYLTHLFRDSVKRQHPSDNIVRIVVDIAL